MSSTSWSLLERAARKSDSRSWSRLAEVYAPLRKHWLRRFDVQDADCDDLEEEVLASLKCQTGGYHITRRSEKK